MKNVENDLNRLYLESVRVEVDGIREIDFFDLDAGDEVGQPEDLVVVAIVVEPGAQVLVPIDPVIVSHGDVKYDLKVWSYVVRI